MTPLTDHTHHIHNLTLEVAVPTADEVHYLQNRLSSACQNQLTRELDALFSRYTTQGQHIRFKRLEIDAGNLRPDYLEEDLVTATVNAFEEILKDLEAGIPHPDAEVLTSELTDLDSLLTYLETGTLGWPVAPGTTPDSLIERMAERQPVPLRETIRRLGQAAAVRKRIAWHLADGTVRTIIRNIEPVHHPFVLQYADDLQNLHQREKLVEASSDEFAKMKWEFILLYLLLESGTDFNTLTLVRSNLRQMAARYNITYVQMLDHFASAVTEAQQNLAQQVNLPKILTILQVEAYKELGRRPPRKSLARRAAEPEENDRPTVYEFDEDWPERLRELLTSRWLGADVPAQEEFILRAVAHAPTQALEIIAEVLRNPEVLRQVASKFSESWLTELVMRLSLDHKPALVQMLHQWREGLLRPSATHLSGREARRSALALFLQESLPGGTSFQAEEWLSQSPQQQLIAPVLSESTEAADQIETLPDDLLERSDWAELLEALFKGMPLPKGIDAPRLVDAFVLRTLRPTSALTSTVARLTRQMGDRQMAAARLPLVAIQAILRLITPSGYPALHHQAELWVEGVADLLPGRRRAILRKAVWQQLFIYWGEGSLGEDGKRLPETYRNQVVAALIAHFGASSPAHVEALRSLLQAASPESSNVTSALLDRQSEQALLLRLFEMDKLPVALSRKAELATSLLLLPQEQRLHLRKSLREGGSQREGAAWLLRQEGGTGARALVLLFFAGEESTIAAAIVALAQRLRDAGAVADEAAAQDILWTSLWEILVSGSPPPEAWKAALADAIMQRGGIWAEVAAQMRHPALQLLSALDGDVRRVNAFWQMESSTSMNETERAALTESLSRLAQRHPHRLASILAQLSQSAAARTRLLRVMPPASVIQAMEALGMVGHREAAALLALARQAWAQRPFAPISEAEFQTALVQFIFEHFARDPEAPFAPEALLRTVTWKVAALARRSEEEVAAWLLRAPAAHHELLHDLLRSVAPQHLSGEAQVPPPPSPESISADFATPEHRRLFVQHATPDDIRTLLVQWKPWHAEMLHQLLLVLFAWMESQPSLAAHAASHRQQLVEQLLAHLHEHTVPQPRVLLHTWLNSFSASGLQPDEMLSQLAALQSRGTLSSSTAPVEAVIEELRTASWHEAAQRAERQQSQLGKADAEAERRMALRSLLIRYLHMGILPEEGSGHIAFLREIFAQDLHRDPQHWVQWLRANAVEQVLRTRLSALLTTSTLHHLLRSHGSGTADALLDLADVWEAALRRWSPSAQQSLRQQQEAAWALLLALLESGGLTGRVGISAMRQLADLLSSASARSSAAAAATLLQSAEELSAVMRSRISFVALQQALEPMAIHRPAEAPATLPQPQTQQESLPAPEPQANSPFPDEPLDPDEPLESFWLDNAGLVLAAPFIPTFLVRCGVLVEGLFPDIKSQQRAAYLLRRITHPKGDIHEPDLALCKLLAGLRVHDPLEIAFEITPHEEEVCAQLIRGMIANWPILGDVKDDTLREGFMVRPGFLYRKESHWQVNVEVKSYDILMEQLPWGISMITYSWLKEIVHVEWWIGTGG